jgi:hypothetical protein
MAVFWDVAESSLVDIDRRFGGAYCLFHLGDRPCDGGIKKLRSISTRLHGVTSHKTIIFTCTQYLIFCALKRFRYRALCKHGFTLTRSKATTVITALSARHCCGRTVVQPASVQFALECRRGKVCGVCVCVCVCLRADGTGHA